MASRITSALARLFGFDAATPTLPAELDNDKMIQSLSMLCGPSLGGRRVVRAGAGGQLITGPGLSCGGVLASQWVLSVLGVWTPLPGIALAPGAVIVTTQLHSLQITAFAPSTPAGVPLGGYLITGAGVANGGSILIDINWPWWAVQPIPLGAGVVGVCTANSYVLGE